MGMSLIEIFDDRQRLDQRPAVIIEGRHQALRVDGEVVGLGLIVSPQMNGRRLVIELFEVKGDADPECGGGPEIAVEFHRYPSISRPVGQGAPAMRPLLLTNTGLDGSKCATYAPKGCCPSRAPLSAA